MSSLVLTALTVLFANILPQGHTSLVYNTSTACFSGSEKILALSATCERNTTEEVGLIAITRTFRGAKRTKCGATDPASSCCQYTEGDCFVEKQPSDSSIQSCSGAKFCQFAADRLNVMDSCEGLGLSDYGFMEYECINSGLMTDMCHDGVIINKPEVYINSNVKHINTEHRDKSCVCLITTSCGASIVFEALDIRLKRLAGGKCGETLHLYDDEEEEGKETGNSDQGETITCHNRTLSGFKKIFRSETNNVILNMTINGNHTGRVWIKATASWPNATVQLHCGATLNLDRSEEHKCPMLEPSTVTSTITSTATSTSTTSKDGVTSGNQGTTLSPGAVGGIIAAGIFIFLIILVLLFLIFKRHRSSNSDHDYDTPSFRDPNYESLHYHNNFNGKIPTEINGIGNPAYDNKVDLDGVTPDYTEITNNGSVHYDNVHNVHNDSVMVMPKGAVM